MSLSGIFTSVLKQVEEHYGTCTFKNTIQDPSNILFCVFGCFGQIFLCLPHSADCLLNTGVFLCIHFSVIGRKTTEMQINDVEITQKHALNHRHFSILFDRSETRTHPRKRFSCSDDFLKYFVYLMLNSLQCQLSSALLCNQKQFVEYFWCFLDLMLQLENQKL